MLLLTRHIKYGVIRTKRRNQTRVNIFRKALLLNYENKSPSNFNNNFRQFDDPLKYILKKEQSGLLIVRRYEHGRKNGFLGLPPKDQDHLTEMICFQLLSQKITYLEPADYLGIANAICALFLGESARTCYLEAYKTELSGKKTKHQPPSGKLYDKLGNETQNLQEIGLIPKSNKSLATVPIGKTQDCKDALEWLAERRDPWKVVVKYWDLMFDFRAVELLRLDNILRRLLILTLDY